MLSLFKKAPTGMYIFCIVQSMGMSPPTTLHLDDAMYYKCYDCGEKHLGQLPDECSKCRCRDFDLVLGEDWGLNKVLKEVRR